MQRVPMTPNGKKILEQKLKHLRTIERPKNIAAIEVARNHGDLSENAEYNAEKERQGQLHAQMKDIEAQLSLAQVIDPSQIKSDKIMFGATVELENLDNENDKKCYMIVGTDEADLNQNKISIESPIARAMIGKQEDDEVIVKTPKGTREYRVVKIEYI